MQEGGRKAIADLFFGGGYAREKTKSPRGETLRRGSERAPTRRAIRFLGSSSYIKRGVGGGAAKYSRVHESSIETKGKLYPWERGLRWASYRIAGHPLIITKTIER